MGANNQPILYAEPITQKPQGETAIYRNPAFKQHLIEEGIPGLKTYKDVIINSKNVYRNKNAVGSIQRTQNHEKINYLSYNQFFNRAHTLGSAIVNENLFNRDQKQKMNFIGIFSKNRVQWSIVDIAGVLFNIVTIPIFDTLGDENITYILRHVELKSLFVDKYAIESLKRTKDLAKLQVVVSFDPLEQNSLQYFKQKGVQLLYFGDLQQRGKKSLVDYNEERFKVNPEDCITFSYTSGTTGPPKGAMISHKNVICSGGAAFKQKDFKLNQNDVILSYLPLPHIMQRQFIYNVLTRGGEIVYYSGDITKIKDDLALVRPTIFATVPRLYSRFYQLIKEKLKTVQGFTKTALDYALQVKLNNVQTTGQYTHPVYDQIFFSKTRQILGGRCRIMLSGGAPLLPQVHSFMKIVMCCPLLEGYGQTQNTAAAFVTQALDPQTRHVGGLMGHTQFKLVDIPDMQYFSTDKDDQGRPQPRGEIWIRGHGVFLGYYKDEEKTKEAITKDGWLMTGDVGQLLPETKAMKIIDRKKNIFKLQQGEYVAAEKVQNVYSKNEYIDEIFIHGESTETFCIAIVVPNKKKLEYLSKKLNIQDNVQSLCNNKKIRLQILKKINQTGKQAGLKGFQQAKNIYLEPKSFMEKKILTNTMKIQRHIAKKEYQPIIANLYNQKQLK